MHACVHECACDECFTTKPLSHETYIDIPYDSSCTVSVPVHVQYCTACTHVQLYPGEVGAGGGRRHILANGGDRDAHRYGKKNDRGVFQKNDHGGVSGDDPWGCLNTVS